MIAFIQPGLGARWLLLAAAGVLVAAYFLTRSAVLTFSSDGGQAIVVPISGMKADEIHPFLDSVLEARFRFTGHLEISGSQKVTGTGAAYAVARVAQDSRETGT